MKRRITFCLVMLVIGITVKAQNLVSNPGFEQHYSCPDNIGQIWKAIGWKSLGYSPDLLSSCDSLNGFGVPYNMFNYQMAASGNSYAGTFQYWETVSDMREYIGTTLITPLQKNYKYFVSMKVNPVNLESGIGSVFINNLGFLFTNFKPDSSLLHNAINRYHIKCDNVITDTLNWTVIKGSFIADSNYSYLILGNLLDDANTLIDSSFTNHSHPYTAYYFIDNVCVTSDSLYNENYITGFNDVPIQNDRIITYPNPVYNSITIKNNSTDKIDNIEIVSIYGDLIKKINNTANTFDVSFLPNGLFFLKLNFKSNKIIIKSFLKIN